MADADIQPAAVSAMATEQPDKQSKSKSKSKSKKPDDAVKLGCGGFFRRRKNKAGKAGGAEAEADDGSSKAPIEKPKKADKPGAGVQMEEGPHSQMWTNIVNSSLVGTGVFSRAAVSNLESGGVFVSNPTTFAPTTGQVAALRDNFDSRGAGLGAGFGVGDTVYRLQEETGTADILCGVSQDDTEGVLVTRTNTALLTCAYTKDLDQAMEMLAEMRKGFISQGC